MSKKTGGEATNNLSKYEPPEPLLWLYNRSPGVTVFRGLKTGITWVLIEVVNANGKLISRNWTQEDRP